MRAFSIKNLPGWKKAAVRVFAQRVRLSGAASSCVSAKNILPEVNGMKKISRRIFSLFIVALLVVTLIPMGAFAEEYIAGPLALDSGETQTCRFKILYVDSSFNLGYNYGADWNVDYTCAYTSGHSGYNHSMNSSVIKEQVNYAKNLVSSDWEIVGWSKEANANPRVLTTYSDTTATQTSYTIYIVAKKTTPAPTPTPVVAKTFTVNYTSDGSLFKTDSKTVSDTAPITSSSADFKVISDVPTKDGYTFKGWVDASNTAYNAGAPFTLSASTANAQVNGNNVTLELKAVWEKNADPEPSPSTSPNPDPEPSPSTSPNPDPEPSPSASPDPNPSPTPSTDPTPDEPGDKVSVPGMLKTANGKTGEGAIGSLKRGDTVDFVLKTNVGEDMMWAEDAETGEKVQRLTQNKETGLWEGAEYKLIVTDAMDGPMVIDGDIAVSINGKDGSNYVTYTSKTDTGFVLSIDCVAALNDGVFTVDDIGTAVVLVTYTAKVNADAEDGAILKNTASVNGSAESVVTGDVTVPVEPPHTGGSGTAMFTVGGLVILAAAFVVLAVSRKKGKEN